MNRCSKCLKTQIGKYCSICGTLLTSLESEVNNGILVETRDLQKSFLVGKLPVYALRGVSMKIKSGEFLAIMGQSGSGKSTLLHLIGTLDVPTQGTILFEGEKISSLNANALANFRLRHIGFVFQTFHLVPSMSVKENVMLPLVFAGVPKAELSAGAESLLETVGLKDRVDHFPSELSGGEQQRVAVARAIANNPTLILADEPTGDLDSKNGQIIMDLLKSLNERGQTICMVTHDRSLASSADRIVHLFDGKQVEDPEIVR